MELQEAAEGLGGQAAPQAELEERCDPLSGPGDSLEKEKKGEGEDPPLPGSHSLSS